MSPMHGAHAIGVIGTVVDVDVVDVDAGCLDAVID
jgi:hypothetical protein